MPLPKSKLVLAVLVAFFLIPVSRAWWNTDWQYRRNITINNAQNSNTLTNYQVPINITYNSNMQSDFDDLRFTWYNPTEDSETEIPYWIEDKVDSSWAYVWVNVTEIPSSGTATVYLYYGNPTATSESSIWNVFLYDDFEDNDISDWTAFGNSFDHGTETINGNVYLYATQPSHTNYNYGLYKNGDFGDFELIFYTIFTTGQSDQHLVKFRDDTGTQDHYNLFLRQSDGDIYFRKYQGGSTYINQGFSYSWQSDKVYKVNVTVIGEKIKVVVNGTTVIDYTDSGTSVLSGKISFGGMVTTASYFDDIRVRKLTDPEPTYSIGEEESLGGSQSLTVSLNSPSSGASLSSLSVDFAFTPIVYDDTIQNCSLWNNETSWGLKQMNTTPVANNSQNTISYTFGSQGTYIWNVQCCNTTDCVFASNNYTLTIDLPPSYSYVGTNDTDNVIQSGEGINLTAELYDYHGLSHAWLSTNETGSWKNYTAFSSTLSVDSVVQTHPFDCFGNSKVFVENSTTVWVIYNYAGGGGGIKVFRYNPTTNEYSSAHTVTTTSGRWHPSIMKCGSKYLAFSDTGGGTSNVWYSSNDGETWTEEGTLATNVWSGHSHPFAYVHNGDCYVIYTKRTGYMVRRKYNQSSNSWLEEENLFQFTCDGCEWQGVEQYWMTNTTHEMVYFVNCTNGADTCTDPKVVVWINESGGWSEHALINNVYKQAHVSAIYNNGRIVMIFGSTNPIFKNLTVYEDANGDGLSFTYKQTLFANNGYAEYAPNVHKISDGKFIMSYSNKSEDGNTNYNINVVELTYETPKHDSPKFVGTSNQWTNVTFTWSNDEISPGAIAWRIYFNDTSGNENATPIQTFSIGGTGGGSDECTPPTNADWIISTKDCSYSGDANLGAHCLILKNNRSLRLGATNLVASKIVLNGKLVIAGRVVVG